MNKLLSSTLEYKVPSILFHLSFVATLQLHCRGGSGGSAFQQKICSPENTFNAQNFVTRFEKTSQSADYRKTCSNSSFVKVMGVGLPL